MPNRYIRGMDEEELAKKLDDMRIEWCKTGVPCDQCCWSLPDDKCILITAEHHISEKYRMRYRNLMKHHRKLSRFILSLETMMLRSGAKVTKCIRPDDVYMYESPLGISDLPVPFKADSALEFVKTTTYLEALDENQNQTD